MASQNTSSLISQVHKSRTIILDLMKKQGYNIKNYQGFSINEVNTMYTYKQLDMSLEKTETETETGTETEKEETKVYIKYNLNKTLRPASLREIIEDLFVLNEVLKKKDTVFIIIKDEVNETLDNFVKQVWESEGIFIVIIPLKHLQFNILDHTLVPPHRVLSNSEKINIKNKYNIVNDSEFPELSRFDPVAKAIGIRPGQVCEIMRPSKTAITAPFYRMCI